MRLSILALVLLVTVVQATRKWCRLSGDPHFTTWDYVRHDCQGAGSFVLFTHEDWSGHGEFGRCNARVQGLRTCLRAASWELLNTKGISNTYYYVKWSTASAQPAYPASPPQYPDPSPAQPAVRTPVYVGPVSRLLADERHAYFEARGSPCTIISMTGKDPTMSQVYSCPYDFFKTPRVLYSTSGDKMWQIRAVPHSRFSHRDQLRIISEHETFGLHKEARYQRHMTMAYQEAADRFIGTNGLCGYQDNKAGNEFVSPSPDLDNKLPGTLKGRRYNGAAVNDWCKLWAVTDSDNHLNTSGVGHGAKPLFNHHVNLQGVHIQNVPTPEFPDASDLATQEAITIDNLDIAKQFETACASLKGVEGGALFADCVYDQGTVGRTVDGITDTTLTSELVDSSLDAAAAAAAMEVDPQPSSSDSGSSAATSAAIGVGVVAGVALIVVGIIFLKLRKTNRNLSHALVLANSGQAGRTGRQSVIELHDNI